MTDENESASPEMERVLRKFELRVKELEKKLLEISKTCMEMGESKGERQWYVLKHAGVHHLVDNYAIRAYCGWPIHPDSEMVGPPKSFDELGEISNHFCEKCVELRRAETTTTIRKEHK